METRDYEVTERAGRRVAGRVVSGPGARLTLTEAEAEHAVQAGELVPAGETLPEAFTSDSEVLAGMRADAERIGGRPRPGPPVVEPAPAASPAPAGAVAAEPAPPQATAAPDAGTASRRARAQPAVEPAVSAATPPAA
ncbi:hypothetical protein [Methylobacterium sp. SyP6R]|uniref:hypothetical protein n=1 Tax=Methylobacterium sp. SyP6R TaxID=2718876 RepID=UPI001F2C74DE|nr:hypothetical protein [Methylobacterium sp. SyP6R]MCF4125044.1 hypothetical protein [Methylobacterium sp. SyP6R]